MDDFGGSFTGVNPQSEIGEVDLEAQERNAARDRPATGEGFVAVIEGQMFVRECIGRGIQSAFSTPVVCYSTLSEFELQLGDAFPNLVLLSLMDPAAKSAHALKALQDLVPGCPIVVLGHKDDLESVTTALHNGARGYIPSTMGLEIAVEALRFIRAGGTYAPTTCILATGQPRSMPWQTSYPAVGITRRELAVVRAIQQGKSNKVIAYDLTLCESTVKVHLRNVMKKIGAKNRTEVAIKAQSLLKQASASLYADAID